MDPLLSALNHPLELYPVQIPGWVEPVRSDVPARGGIPHSIYDHRSEGLQCIIHAWSELKSGTWTTAELDRVDLFVNGGRINGAGFTVQPGEESKQVFVFYLPRHNLREGVNRLHYEITRLSQNVGISKDLNVLYHLRVPGAPAPEGLDLVIPADVIASGVDAARAAEGVKFGFTYSNRRRYDHIDFVIGNIPVSFDVPDGSSPVEHTLFIETFEQAGDNPRTELQFRVTDQLGNSTLSPIKYLDIHLGEAPPGHPLIIDTATMVLDGTEVFVPASSPWTQTDGHGPGNRRSRTPTSGTPPYRYLSANSQIATVGSADGVVTGQRNGQTLISVTDATGQVACYQVQVSNKWDIEARSDYAHGQTLWGWSAAQMPPVEPRPSFVSGLREAIIRRLPDPSEYCHPVWGPDLEVITYGRVCGHADWPADDGEVAVHFYNSDGSIGLTTRPASKIRAAAGWGFRPRDMPQSLLGADTSEIYSALVEASARTVDNMGVKKEQG
jgi:hypothetical protein